MIVKQNSSNGKKKGEITHSEKTSATQQVTLLLKDIKEKKGEMILIAITDRTTIELPAALSQVEREARVANYIKLHKSKI